MKNYKETLKQLEVDGEITVRSLKGTRPKGTFADHLLVRFPMSGSNGG